MRWIILAVVIATLMVHGQESKPHSNTDKRTAATSRKDAPDAASRTVIVVNQQAPQAQENNHPSKPPNYLSRLFSPENIPNIALVMVGIIGIVTAIYTLKRIGHQAVEMRLQRIEMKRLRHETRRQRRIMGEQLDAMQGQLGQMEKQTAELKAAADTAFIAAQAAVENAKAAKLSAEISAGVAIPKLVVHEFGGRNAGAAALSAMLQLPSIKLVIKNYGQTPALLSSWSILFTCEDLPEIPVYSGQPGCGIVLTHDVIQPDQPYTLTVAHYWNRQAFSLDEVQAIIDHRKVLNVYGYVCYGDIFGNPLQRFKFFATALNMGDNWIEWRTELAPNAYVGTDRLPAQKTHQQPDQAN